MLVSVASQAHTVVVSHSHPHGNAGHTVLSAEGFEVRHTAGHEGIHIYTRHAMRHHDRAWGDTADRYCWQLERSTRGVQQDVSAFRHPQGCEVSRGEPGCAVSVAVMDSAMQLAIVAQPAATTDQRECHPR